MIFNFSLRFSFNNILISRVLLFIILIRLLALLLVALNVIELDSFLHMIGGNSGNTGGFWHWNPSGIWEWYNNGGQGPSRIWIPFATDEDGDKAITNLMHSKLEQHRIDCATSVPYDTRMKNSFTPQEHEYVCSKVVQAVNQGKVNSDYLKFVLGPYPDRFYNGRISVDFINKFFPRS